MCVRERSMENEIKHTHTHEEASNRVTERYANVSHTHTHTHKQCKQHRAIRLEGRPQNHTDLFTVAVSSIFNQDSLNCTNRRTESQYSYGAAHTCLLDHAGTAALSSAHNKSLVYIQYKQMLNLSPTQSISLSKLEINNNEYSNNL